MQLFSIIFGMRAEFNWLTSSNQWCSWGFHAAYKLLSVLSRLSCTSVVSMQL